MLSNFIKPNYVFLAPYPLPYSNKHFPLLPSTPPKVLPLPTTAIPLLNSFHIPLLPSTYPVPSISSASPPSSCILPLCVYIDRTFTLLYFTSALPLQHGGH